MTTPSRIKNLDRKINTGEFSSQDIRLIRSNFMPHTFNEILANYREQNSAVVNSLAAIAAIDTIRGSKTRRIFLKYSLLFGSAFIINSCASSGGNKDDNTPTETPDRTFTMRFVGKDILTDANLENTEFTTTDYAGTTKELRHGDSAEMMNGIENMVINAAPGYRVAYIVAKHPSTKEILFTRDKEGGQGVNLKTGYSHLPDSFDVNIGLIPTDLDTELLASCIGEDISTTSNSFGDGTVQRYVRDYEAGEVIDVGIWENAPPGPNTYEIAEKVHRRINQGSAVNTPGIFGIRLIPWEEAVANQVSSLLSNGFTVFIDTYSAGNSISVNSLDEVTSSHAVLGNTDPDEGIHIVEGSQATICFSRDGGEKREPYISAKAPYNFQNDAERSFKTLQLLPCGFVLDYGSRTP